LKPESQRNKNTGLIEHPQSGAGQKHIMKRPQLVSQGSLTRMLQSAEEAWRKKDFQQNLDILERACRLDPANVNVRLQLGRMLGLRYDYAAAERSFEKAVQFAGRKAEALAAAGRQSRDFRNTEIAEKFFKRALQEKDATAEMFVFMAEFYERARRINDASGYVEEALRRNPACATALLARARLAADAGMLEEAEAQLRSFPASADRDTQVRKGYQLGSILDRQKRYDEAMQAFLGAKQLLQPDAKQFALGLQTIRSRLKEMTENITDEMVSRWREAKIPDAPRRLALLCGHPRSGTTLLEQVLDSHPDIVSAEETEIFHDEAYVPLTQGMVEPRMLPVLEAAKPEALRHSREQYFRYMELCLGRPIAGRLLIDKNPSLTFLVPALVRVFPEMKVLTALRDPRDVCLSCFMQPFVPVAQTSSAYLTLEGTVGEYIFLMSVWRAVAPMLKSSALEVRYEDMVEDLESVSRRALEFVGVAWDERVLAFHEHARQKTVRSPTYADVTKPVFKRAVGRWRNYEKYLAPYLEKLEPFVKAFGYE
jgi:tetratricopeptide (TPR) repeat protein